MNTAIDYRGNRYNMNAKLMSIDTATYRFIHFEPLDRTLAGPVVFL
jgi:hypothetical protein